MHPTIFGFIDSYWLMIGIGIIGSFFIAELFYRWIKKDKRSALDVEIMGLISIAAGIVFAILFQNLYNFIESPSTYTWGWGLTFAGGLLGGAGTFIAVYFGYFRKRNGPMMEDGILLFAPVAIAEAHAWGRIGCFLSGCCYGVETDSWIGVQFPDLPNKVVPTNLIEAIFLFLLSGVLFYFCFKRKSRFTMPIYLIGYGIFRFVIEFWRGDHRGSFIPNLTPSQFWAIVMVVIGLGYIAYEIYQIKKKPPVSEQESE